MNAQTITYCLTLLAVAVLVWDGWRRHIAAANRSRLADSVVRTFERDLAAHETKIETLEGEVLALKRKEARSIAAPLTGSNRARALRG